MIINNSVVGSLLASSKLKTHTLLLKCWIRILASLQIVELAELE